MYLSIIVFVLLVKTGYYCVVEIFAENGIVIGIVILYTLGLYAFEYSNIRKC